MAPLVVRLLIVFAGGACLGSLVNWAVYTFAWMPRPISPWSRWRAEGVRLSKLDRVPIVGWYGLRREAPIHGPGFWLRPMLLEIGVGAALAALYWWEVERLALIRGQLAGAAIAPPIAAVLGVAADRVQGAAERALLKSVLFGFLCDVPGSPGSVSQSFAQPDAYGMEVSGLGAAESLFG